MYLGLIQLSHVIISLFHIVHCMLLEKYYQLHHLHPVRFCLWRVFVKSRSSIRCSISVRERLLLNLQESDESIEHFWCFFTMMNDELISTYIRVSFQEDPCGRLFFYQKPRNHWPRQYQLHHYQLRVLSWRYALSHLVHKWVPLLLVIQYLRSRPLNTIPIFLYLCCLDQAKKVPSFGSLASSTSPKISGGGFGECPVIPHCHLRAIQAKITL